MDEEAVENSSPEEPKLVLGCRLRLFSGCSLREVLAQGLLDALTGLRVANLTKCNDAKEWADHLVEFHMPQRPFLDWEQPQVQVREGRATIQVHFHLARIPEKGEAPQCRGTQTLLTLRPEAPLPPGGLDGRVGDACVVFYLHQVSDFDVVRTAVENNLQMMQTIVDEFVPLFRQMVEAEVTQRLADHAKDAHLLDEFVQMIGARVSRD